MKMSADFTSDRTELFKLEPFTAEFAAAAGLEAKDLFALQIVVEELVTNVIDYGGVPAGQHAACVTLSLENRELIIVIKDCGRPYNPLLREAPNTTLSAEKRPIGGLGVHFCKKLTDAQDYERADDCNILTLRKKISA